MKMEEVSISELEALVQTTLSNKRCRHVLNVRDAAVKMTPMCGGVKLPLCSMTSPRKWRQENSCKCSKHLV